MKIGKLWIGLDRSEKIDEGEYDAIDKEYEEGIRSGKKLILGVLVARSGTRWLGDIFDSHKNATGVTERNAGAESFYRYITYNKLPIDTIGIIALIKKGIIDDWKKGDIALVNSPYFSHGIKELNETLRPERIIFGINDPEFTVQSIYNKDLFKHSYLRDRTDYALGFQPTLNDRWSHFFGRIVPNGNFYKTWLHFTRIGKIAWWGNRITVDIHKQLEDISREKIFIFHLKDADQNYEYYKNLAVDFDLTPVLSEKKFLSIKGKTVTKSQNVKHEWNARESEEFQKQTKEWYDIYKKLCQ